MRRRVAGGGRAAYITRCGQPDLSRVLQPGKRTAVDIQTIAQKISQRMAGSGFGRSVKVDLQGAGTLLIDGESVTVGDGDADCTISVSADDFAEIVAGTLSPTTAFMTGKMKIDGDMGAAMALSQAL